MSVKYCSQIVAQVHILHSIIHSIMFLILIHSIGAHRIQGDGVVYRVNKIIMHAGFSMSHLRNDIALMRLVKPVQLGPKVGTVCFPRKNTRVATGTKCWISGLSSLIKETGCLFLVIDSNSISVIVLARNANLVGRGGGDSTTFHRCMTFCGSGGGEAEERDCSLNCWQFMVLTMNCQQKKLHLHCLVPLT